MSSSNLPRLQFSFGSSSGFTPSGISGFSDLRPAAIVRELIQNSLDAAIEANVRPAKIRIRLTCCKKEEIPSIQEYEKAFDLAVATHTRKKELSSQASRVVDVIQKSLNQKKQVVLSVLDNGIGLDDSRMNALLSDGISVKGGSAMGTYGNGHSTIIPASDLRYVLYGGVNSEGNRIGSGHAVLASSKKVGQPQPMSGDGFLIQEMKDGSHVCATGQNLHPLIAKDIDWIVENFERGTVVIVPAFNYFRREEENLWDLVSKSASHSFFSAIHEGRLIVEFEDLRSDYQNSDLQILDRGKLKGVLEEGKEKKRKTQGDFMSGARAYSAYDTFCKGEKDIIETKQGHIEIRWMYDSTDSGITRIDLCRNGMWITDEKNIPGLRYAFSDRKPFHAVLMLDSERGGKLHEFVRNAEGPLHNEIHPKQRLKEEEVQALKKSFTQIKEWLECKISKIESDSYMPDDFLALDFGGQGEGGKNNPSFWGIPEVINKYVPSKSYTETNVGPGPRRSKGETKRLSTSQNSRPQPQLGPMFTATSVAVGANCQRIYVECKGRLSDAQLRLCVDQNLDATCDLRSKRNDTEAIVLREIQIDGKSVARSKLIGENGHIKGVHLGSIKPDDNFDIIVEYSLPPGLILPPDHQPTLRVDIFKGEALADS